MGKMKDPFWPGFVEGFAGSYKPNFVGAIVTAVLGRYREALGLALVGLFCWLLTLR